MFNFFTLYVWVPLAVVSVPLASAAFAGSVRGSIGEGGMAAVVGLSAVVSVACGAKVVWHLSEV